MSMMLEEISIKLALIKIKSGSEAFLSYIPIFFASGLVLYQTLHSFTDLFIVSIASHEILKS
jgi:hypothetical protein